MGYYTTFKCNTDLTEEQMLRLEQISDYSCPFDEQLKWYNFDKDMIAFSKEYPDELFEISGKGEEQGDIWTAWFKDGKMVKKKAEIKYPRYDSSWFPEEEVNDEDYLKRLGIK